MKELICFCVSNSRLVTVIPRPDAESSTKSKRNIWLLPLDSASERGMTVTSRPLEVGLLSHSLIPNSL